MCPELWCRKLATYDQGGGGREQWQVVCGRRGPLDLGVSSLGRSGEAPPGCPGDRRHLWGCAPCCFKNLKGMMVERLQACEEAGQCAQAPWNRASGPGCRDNYKMTGSTVPLPPAGTGGTLPQDMPKWAFGRLQGGVVRTSIRSNAVSALLP
jgi:hypothetical protein